MCAKCVFKWKWYSRLVREGWGGLGWRVQWMVCLLQRIFQWEDSPYSILNYHALLDFRLIPVSTFELSEDPQVWWPLRSQLVSWTSQQWDDTLDSTHLKDGDDSLGSLGYLPKQIYFFGASFGCSWHSGERDRRSLFSDGTEVLECWHNACRNAGAMPSLQSVCYKC